MNDLPETPHAEDLGNKLLINKTPISGPIALKRLVNDARKARRARQFSEAIVGPTLDKRVHFSTQGTFILLLIPGLLRKMNCPDATTVTGLIQPFNSWLATRSEAIDSEIDPSTRLVELDAEIDALGYPKAKLALIAISGSKELRLPLEDLNGCGGELIVPPTSRVVATLAEKAGNASDIETVLSIKEVTELATAGGSTARLSTSTVADDVKVGAPALLHRARAVCITLKRVSAIKRKKRSGETS